MTHGDKRRRGLKEAENVVKITLYIFFLTEMNTWVPDEEIMKTASLVLHNFLLLFFVLFYFFCVCVRTVELLSSYLTLSTGL